MRISPIAMFAFAIAATSQAAEPPAPSVQESRQIARTLAGELKEALTAALAESPDTAVAVCKERAPEIAARLSARHGASVGRTALRVRNPDNAPEQWQRETLEDFQRRIASGEDPAGIELWTAVRDGDVVEHRYMRPIVMEGMCTVCHGESISADVQRSIREHYPEDAATGFRPGELRGAVYVVKEAPAMD
ncbi:MAG TPA: DUF3365 domain-containing protein [Steroidobacter sp.]|nr:DUF3365 domain-containing protein [Steroidobacter sp.]